MKSGSKLHQLHPRSTLSATYCSNATPFDLPRIALSCALNTPLFSAFPKLGIDPFSDDDDAPRPFDQRHPSICLQSKDYTEHSLSLTFSQPYWGACLFLIDLSSRPHSLPPRHLPLPLDKSTKLSGFPSSDNTNIGICEAIPTPRIPRSKTQRLFTVYISALHEFPKHVEIWISYKPHHTAITPTNSQNEYQQEAR